MSDASFWFVQTNGTDLLAVGESLVFAGCPFDAFLFDRRTGELVEDISYEEGPDDDPDLELDGDPEDQFLHVAHLSNVHTFELGAHTISVVPVEGRIVGAGTDQRFTPAANPLVVDGYTFTNALEGLTVTGTSGRTWEFPVEHPMFSEPPIVGFAGWAYAATSAGPIVVVRLDDSALDAALAAWDPNY